MKTERKKQLLVSLILDDLVHARLVHGLLAMGLPADYYAHDVPFAVMELMGFNEEQQHQIFPRYRLWQEQAAHIDISRVMYTCATWRNAFMKCWKRSTAPFQ